MTLPFESELNKSYSVNSLLFALVRSAWGGLPRIKRNYVRNSPYLQLILIQKHAFDAWNFVKV